MSLRLPMIAFALVSVFATSFSLTAGAAGVKDKKRWEQATKEVDSVKVEAEASCGVKFDFSFDKESFVSGTNVAQLDKQGMNGYCGDAFAAMKDLCKDTDYREAMASVKSVSCAYGKDLAKPETSLKDGQLTFRFNWDTANHRRTVREFLENKL